MRVIFFDKRGTVQKSWSQSDDRSLICKAKCNSFMRLFGVHIFFIFLLTLPPKVVSAQMDSCCNNLICNAKASRFGTDLMWYLRSFGPYIDNEVKRGVHLDSMEKVYPDRIRQIEQLLASYEKWKGNSVSRSLCVNKNINDIECASWLNYFLEKQYSSKLRSPEFVNGIGGNVNINQGVIAPFTSSEQYSFLGETFLSYTFTGKGEPLESVTKNGHYKAGGSLRLMVGPSIYYTKQTVFLIAQVRTEIRLADVGNNLTTLGCSKLIVQGRFNDKFQMAGIGLAFELACFNLQLTGDYDFAGHKLMFLSGLGYRFYNHFKMYKQ